MDRKLKTWELALMCGVLIAVMAGSWLGREQKELAGSVIRFHVIANSNSEEDQALKLAVRDRVLKEAQDLYPENATLAQAQAALEGRLSLLAAAGREVVEEQGYDYPVSAALEDCWFPTKEYEGFALPAGSYTALRVTPSAWPPPLFRADEGGGLLDGISVGADVDAALVQTHKNAGDLRHVQPGAGQLFGAGKHFTRGTLH